MTRFSIDWFTAHIPTWTDLMGDLTNQRVLEIGSLEGMSALWFLDNVVGEHGHIWCVDAWREYEEFPDMEKQHWVQVEENFDHNISGYTAVTKIKAPTAEAWPYLVQTIKKPLDIIYIDGSHLTQSCLRDMIFGWSLLARGGLMIVDDYEWHNPHKWWSPKTAVDTFMVCYDGGYELLHMGKQVVLKKMTEDK